MLNKLLNKIKENKKEFIILTILLFISGIAHGYNMFHFPYYENDEGVYMSQAWSFVTEGRLAPYTYWYDHAPAGWILISLWTKLTGGFFTFGVSVNSGRVLMLLLHLGTTFLLYYIAKKLSKNSLAGVIAVLIFSLSPLGIYFQRRVLLDNIMIFWTMLSLAILLKDKLKLSQIMLSALAFGVGVLTKENAVFFIPAFLYLIFCKSHKYHKEFAIIKWLAIVVSLVSIYFLYAILKGEFFPAGSILGGNGPHVSLMETLRYQASRSGGSILDLDNSHFWTDFRFWFKEDRLLLVLGTLSTYIIFLFGLKKKPYLSIALMSTLFWLFLMRGGEVIEFYIVPLIPLLALSIGLVAHEFLEWILRMSPPKIIYRFFSLILIVGLVFYYFLYGYMARGFNIYTANQTKAQIEALKWIRSNINQRSSVVVIDNYGYVDLQAKNNPSSKQFVNAEWYWKIDRDNAIRLGLLKNDPSNIDVIAVTPQTNADLTQGSLSLLSKAMGNATIKKRFWNDGWGVEFWFTRYPKQVLFNSWNSYKRNFIIRGRTIDPQENGITTSEAQSYSLLRAVWMDDKDTFDKVYRWTKNNLQLTNGLFAWRWEGSVDSGSIIDYGTATDADQDIALALLFAHKQWGQKNYLQKAKRVIRAIWIREVAIVDNTPYLIAGNWANQQDTIIINPSYLSPASYRIFAEVDIYRPWFKLIDSSYQILQNCTINPLDKEIGVLPPEWCALDKESGEITQPTSPQPSASEYSYNAFRIPWRVALDYRWFKEPMAKKYLKTLSFLSKEWEEKQRISTAYQHDGNIWEEYESVSAYAGNLGYFSILYPEIAKDIYSEKILNKFYEDENQSYWEDPKNYYTQNWAWFGTALYSNSLPNLWTE